MRRQQQRGASWGSGVGSLPLAGAAVTAGGRAGTSRRRRGQRPAVPRSAGGDPLAAPAGVVLVGGVCVAGSPGEAKKTQKTTEASLFLTQAVPVLRIAEFGAHGEK